ncbi:MAG TPA: DUF2891 domain-containing protein [Vicinamibacterales bacterium]
MKVRFSILAILIAVLVSGCSSPKETPAASSPPAAPPVPELPALTAASASNFAQLTLKCVQKKYPNQPGLILNGPADVMAPEKAHPAFYGCYDWHSSVHGHWMLARLLRLFPSLPEAPQIKKALSENLSAKNLETEAAYFKRPGAQAFERTYGWAWTLKLAEELHVSSSPEARAWAANLKPLADTLAARYLDFLPKQVYPIRTGLHPNTAFGLAFALDYASTVGDAKLKELLIARSNDYFGNDTDYPAKLEPSGSDFLSPTLAEADLMRRVLPADKFASWFHAYLPALAKGEPKNLLEIAIVSDRTDPQLGHLDGLNLSRAWSMRHIAASLPENDPARWALEDAGHTHAIDALQHVATGHYEGEHWLGSFAVYLLTEPK